MTAIKHTGNLNLNIHNSTFFIQKINLSTNKLIEEIDRIKSIPVEIKYIAKSILSEEQYGANILELFKNDNQIIRYNQPEYNELRKNDERYSIFGKYCILNDKISLVKVNLNINSNSFKSLEELIYSNNNTLYKLAKIFTFLVQNNAICHCMCLKPFILINNIENGYLNYSINLYTFPLNDNESKYINKNFGFVEEGQNGIDISKVYNNVMDEIELIRIEQDEIFNKSKIELEYKNDMEINLFKTLESLNFKYNKKYKNYEYEFSPGIKISRTIIVDVNSHTKIVTVFLEDDVIDNPDIETNIITLFYGNIEKLNLKSLKGLMEFVKPI